MKQSSVSLSTAEEEYITTYSSICESIWLRKLMSGLFDMGLDTAVILCDKQSCIQMAKNPMFHDKKKNIRIWYFYLRDMVQKETINLQSMSIDEKVVYVLTSPLSRVNFEYFRENPSVV